MRGSALLALLLVLAVFAPATALAQDTATPTATPENATAAPPEGERIDGNTELMDASYDGETGMISVTIRSESLQPITVTDAGAFMTGGEVEQRTVTLSEGETSTIRIPATEYEGFVGVSIATRETLYAVPLEVSNPWFQGAPTWETTRYVGLGAVVGVLLVTAYLAKKRLRGGEGEVESVA